ncbi:UNVERIFIED_CONTAM: hypothetical protein NCL1_52345 [Trichonephila clavipes]
MKEKNRRKLFHRISVIINKRARECVVHSIESKSHSKGPPLSRISKLRDAVRMHYNWKIGMAVDPLKLSPAPSNTRSRARAPRLHLKAHQ